MWRRRTDGNQECQRCNAKRKPAERADSGATEGGKRPDMAGNGLRRDRSEPGSTPGGGGDVGVSGLNP